MVALCICLRNFTDTVQWKIQEYYAPDKAFKLVLSCHSSVSYLFPLLNVHRMDAAAHFYAPFPSPPSPELRSEKLEGGKREDNSVFLSSSSSSSSLLSSP